MEAGHGCPISMTYSIVPALRAEPTIAAAWEPLLTSTTYDPARLRRRARATKRGRHRRHGHDREAGRVRRAGQHHHGPSPPAATGPGEEYAITGHKWFCSAPMSDLFLTLASTDAGLSCFADAPLAARRHPQRASPSSGSRTSSATSPTRRARSRWTARSAALVGEEGRGIPTILDDGQPHPARLRDRRRPARCGPAFSQAVHHARHRRAFGKLLIDQPLMRNVLADLAVESEAATSLDDPPGRRLRPRREARSPASPPPSASTGCASGRRCSPTRRSSASAAPATWRRRRWPGCSASRPLNGIWEGSGNVICLDVLRAAGARPGIGGGAAGRDPARLGAPTTGSTGPSRTCTPSWPTPPTWRSGPAASSNGPPSRSRARCWCATHRLRWPTRSAPPASPATAGGRSARSRLARTSPRSSTGPGRSS